jgi:hypothetical protein
MYSTFCIVKAFKEITLRGQQSSLRRLGENGIGKSDQT